MSFQQIHRTADYGSNLRSVSDALDAQRERHNLVVSYEKDVNKLPKDARVSNLIGKHCSQLYALVPGKSP